MSLVNLNEDAFFQKIEILSHLCVYYSNFILNVFMRLYVPNYFISSNISTNVINLRMHSNF